MPVNPFERDFENEIWEKIPGFLLIMVINIGKWWGYSVFFEENENELDD